MPNGDSTANVGDLVEMESQTGEIDQLRIGDVRTYGGRGRHFRNSEFRSSTEAFRISWFGDPGTRLGSPLKPTTTVPSRCRLSQRDFYRVAAGGAVFTCDLTDSDPLKWRMDRVFLDVILNTHPTSTSDDSNSDRDSTLAHNVGQIPWEFIDYNKVPYIVESSAGELLVIVREGHPHPTAMAMIPTLISVISTSLESIMGLMGFECWRWIERMHGIWTEKKSLGDNVAFFFGHNEYICIDVSKIPEIKSNFIYYTDNCWPDYVAFKHGGGKDLRIYNLEDGSMTPLLLVPPSHHAFDVSIRRVGCQRKPRRTSYIMSLEICFGITVDHCVPSFRSSDPAELSIERQLNSDACPSLARTGVVFRSSPGVKTPAELAV
ncbi:hypothetical protein Acr_18g0008680 [Actinidia rufa]|uniref:KIB1-4 beta-propeller domain-containing protein n=1 Tax=Actinidia rufa TaxID=165716 RepID=A0A7J0G7K3_9ERIC|nr:hypothetical protein Acr_18g0008680 [Actinidia rufa]